jgi:hypothetical protein
MRKIKEHKPYDGIYQEEKMMFFISLSFPDVALKRNVTEFSCTMHVTTNFSND